MDVIELEGMEFFARHGCFKEEQVIGNTFIVYARIEADLSIAAQTDNINDTVNYQSVYQLIQQEMAIPSKLLEHVAARILHKLKGQFSEIKRVTIKVSKLNPPMGGKIGASSVTMSL